MHATEIQLLIVNAPVLLTMNSATQKIKTASTLRRVLLICGILASLIYVATDILAGKLWEGYSFTSQAISELSAIGAPTRPLVVTLGIIYDVLLIAFGLCVWVLAGQRRRALRLTGGLLVGIGGIGLVWTQFPMHLRGAEMTFTDTMHWTIAGVVVLLILLMIALGVIAYRKWFRLYSIGTLVTLLVVGMWSIFVGGAQIAAHQSTPVFGVMERITVYGYLAWVAALAIVLLLGNRDPGSTTTPH
jgi:hypothetical membrane protein